MLHQARHQRLVEYRNHRQNSPAMSIIQNKKAFHDYFIEDKFEAGLMLEGWEVKAIRAGRVQLKEAYVLTKDGALWLFGSHISPLLNASTHIHPDPVRTRKLLLHKHEIDKLIGKVQRAGFTIMPLDMHYKGGRVKLEIGLAKGKKEHDKRATEREKDAKREAANAMKKERR
ncbi:MAG: SsrA-binding protein SmpB [Gammaproteobacteria bacterium]|nr:SsrA-binding protein SmpB [Gammaproteobacteria bacterium]MDD5471888.1 SsrA-binding protein SmpB [Sideroxydans sp.]